MNATGRLITALALCALCGSGSGQTAPSGGNETVAPGYSMTLAQPANPVRLDSPIEVKMTIKNITDGDIFWRAVRDTGKDPWYPGFRFLLKKDGKEVDTTFFHRKISGRQRPDDPAEVWSGSTILLPKPPGVMFVLTLDLKRLYQITEPGEYTFEVSRIAEDDKTVVRSNAVTLDIAR